MADDRTPVSREELWTWFRRIREVAYAVGKADDFGTQEELARDALLRMQEKRHLINDPTQIFTIVKNLRITEHRKWARQIPTDPEVIERELVSLDDPFEKAACQEVVDAISELSPDHQAVIILAVHGYDSTTQSQILGIQVGTARSRLSRARAILRERFQE